MAELHIYKSSGGGFDVKIDESTVIQQRLFGENVINSSFTARQVLNLDIGDYIVYDNIRYYINTMPTVTKNARNNYEYSITFESQYYDLSKVQYMYDEMGEFDFAGDADDFIDILITNLARVFGAGVWTKGTVDPTDTDVKLLHFSAVNCAEAMITLSNEFSGEFYYDNKEISFTDEVGSDISVTLEYRAGLFNFTRNTVDTKNIITRIYPFGSQKNIDITTYGYDRLRPTPDGGNYYFDQNTASYGIIEHTKIFEEVFPTRTGTITSINGGDILKFTDSGMDFDLNSYLLPGITAKIHFQTGDLGGYEFEIVSYNAGTKEFEIAAYTDGQGFTLPEAPLVVAVNDTYKLIDIKMPASYITTAEDLLQTKALAYLAENSSARVSYALSPDWKYLKTNGIDIKIGDFIRVVDTDLGITSLLRVVYLTRQVMNQWKCTLELSDDYVVSLPQRVYAETVRNERRLEFDNIGDVINHRRNWRSTEELRQMVFDPDGYFDVDSNIRPLSVTTAMLSVGVGSQQFTLSAQIYPNYTGDASKVETGAGYLAHFTIDPAGIQTWTLYANSYSGLTAGTAYYIYAKCHKTDYTNANNEIVIDATQRLINADATYYYFLIGILHSVVDSVRGISLTYGQTTINGKFITTGKIQSANTNTYLDLDNNTLVIASGAGTIAGTNITSIEDGADVTGNHSAAEIANLPATPAGAGLYADATHLGYYTGAAWATYMDNTGNFYLGGSGGSLIFTEATGALTLGTALSGQRVELDGINNRLVFYDSAGNAKILIDEDITYGDHIAVGSSIRITESGVFTEILNAAMDDGQPGQFTRFNAGKVLAIDGGESDAYAEVAAFYGSGAATLTKHPSSGAGNREFTLNSMDISLSAGALVDGVDVSEHKHTGVSGQGEKVAYTSLSSIPSLFAPDSHGFTDDAVHTATGLTSGHFLKATGATTFGFSAHGLTASDVGAAPSSHVGAGGGAHANVVAAGDAGFMTGTDKTKLNGIEALADVTDATNVATAGAIMDGDFSSNGFMRRTGAGAYDVSALGLTTSFYVAGAERTLSFTNGLLISAVPT
jgi:hypothetical protein